jgi:hypothetical protein
VYAKYFADRLNILDNGFVVRAFGLVPDVSPRFNARDQPVPFQKVGA